MSNTELEQRNQRVMEYLRTLYGADPVPLRACLHNAEAAQLQSKFTQKFGGHMFDDLDLSGYSCRWRSAVEDGIRAGSDPMTWQFWQAARLTFLELGGCYRDGMEPPKNE